MRKTVEHIHTISTCVRGPDGTQYEARILGERRDDGTWSGWIEFQAQNDSGSVLTTGQETYQPDRRAPRARAARRGGEHVVRHEIAQGRPDAVRATAGRRRDARAPHGHHEPRPAAPRGARAVLHHRPLSRLSLDSRPASEGWNATD